MFDYDVFFSYRHRPLDSEITQKLFNLAENYRLPASLNGSAGNSLATQTEC